MPVAKVLSHLDLMSYCDRTVHLDSHSCDICFSSFKALKIHQRLPFSGYVLVVRSKVNSLQLTAQLD